MRDITLSSGRTGLHTHTDTHTHLTFDWSRFYAVSEVRTHNYNNCVPPSVLLGVELMCNTFRGFVNCSNCFEQSSGCWVGELD